jgi:hypothetical protein
LRELAATAIDAISARLSYGQDVRSAVVEVIGSAFNGELPSPDRAPGDDDTNGYFVMPIDQRAIDRIAQPSSKSLARPVPKGRSRTSWVVCWLDGRAHRSAELRGVLATCEPTGHRWRWVWQTRPGRVSACVQSLRVHVEREADDYTRDKIAKTRC